MDDRTDRQILLGLETTVTQLGNSITEINKRMDDYEQNQVEMLRLLREHFVGGPSTS